MESFIAPRKQADFVNKAIRQSLEQMKKERNKQQAIDSLEQLYSSRIKSDKTAVELVREIRHERVDRLTAESKKNEK